MLELIVIMKEDSPSAERDHPRIIYRMFDPDRNGMISREEMTDLLSKIAPDEMSREQFEDSVEKTFLKYAPKNQDGLKFKEFEQIYKKR